MVQKQQQQEVRKGPWTEQEDLKLVSFVGLFGDRRWDFIAMVSGLNRTGKSCRLRWVNYLHPGLKRGKMTPQEERLVLDLQSKWGNRWSRIARKLPGRTDNEIKNYWRTHMRKKAHDKKRRSEVPSSSSGNFSTSSNNHAVDSHVSKDAGEESFYDTGGPDDHHHHMVGSTTQVKLGKEKDHGEEFSMDDIWKDIDHLSEENSLQQHQLPVLYDGHSEEGCNFSCQQLTSTWEYSSWVMDEGSNNMLFPMIDPNYFSNNINVQYNNPAYF